MKTFEEAWKDFVKPENWELFTNQDMVRAGWNLHARREQEIRREERERCAAITEWPKRQEVGLYYLMDAAKVIRALPDEGGKEKNNAQR